jgi:HD-GYP domain-containing protein (c-di-GMP phosphodiesterase class II)
MSTTYSANQQRRARDLLARLAGALRAARFYPVAHPAVEGLVAELYEVVVAYHAEGVDVALTFFEGELLLGEQLLPEESVLFDQLIRDMGDAGAGSVTLARGLSLEELARVVQVLATDPDTLRAAGGPSALISATGTPHVQIAQITVVDDSGTPVDAETVDDPEAARLTYTSAIDLLRELERAIDRREPLAPGYVKGVVATLIDAVLTNRYAMLELSGLKDYDEYTFYHSVNVAILSLALGSTITTDRRFLSTLGVGALLHDIGKIAIDVDVLNKPGALTAEEWSEVRGHPIFGAELASAMPGLDRAGVVVIFEHHLRHDNGGYPKVPMARRQHLASRIVAVTDAYDAMTSRRSYSAARLQDEAMSVLVKNAGTAFDPMLVRLFVDLMGVYPPRSVVELSTGELAVVTRANAADITRPTVRIFATPAGDVLIEPLEVELGVELPGGRSIVRCLDEDALNVDVEDYI